MRAIGLPDVPAEPPGELLTVIAGLL